MHMDDASTMYLSRCKYAPRLGSQDDSDAHALHIPEVEQQLGGKRVVADGPADDKAPIAPAYQLPHLGPGPCYYLFLFVHRHIPMPRKATGLLFHSIIPPPSVFSSILYSDIHTY